MLWLLALKGMMPPQNPTSIHSLPCSAHLFSFTPLLQFKNSTNFAVDLIISLQPLHNQFVSLGDGPRLQTTCVANIIFSVPGGKPLHTPSTLISRISTSRIANAQHTIEKGDRT